MVLAAQFTSPGEPPGPPAAPGLLLAQSWQATVIIGGLMLRHAAGAAARSLAGAADSAVVGGPG